MCTDKIHASSSIIISLHKVFIPLNNVLQLDTYWSIAGLPCTSKGTGCTHSSSMRIFLKWLIPIECLLSLLISGYTIALSFVTGFVILCVAASSQEADKIRLKCLGLFLGLTASYVASYLISVYLAAVLDICKWFLMWYTLVLKWEKGGERYFPLNFLNLIFKFKCKSITFVMPYFFLFPLKLPLPWRLSFIMLVVQLSKNESIFFYDVHGTGDSTMSSFLFWAVTWSWIRPSVHHSIAHSDWLWFFRGSGSGPSHKTYHLILWTGHAGDQTFCMSDKERSLNLWGGPPHLSSSTCQHHLKSQNWKELLTSNA